MATTTQDILSEFIKDVEHRHSLINDYKGNIGTGIAYSESSTRYQNYVKEVICNKISHLTGIPVELASKQFDTYLQEAIVTEYISSQKSDDSNQFFSLKKQIKNETSKNKKIELNQQLNSLKEKIYSQIPNDKKTFLTDRFIENQIVPKHANLKMKAEINSPDDGYCLKAITESLYNIAEKYGNTDFLPDNNSENGIPKTFLSNLEKNNDSNEYIFKNTENQTFNNLVEKHNIAPGAIVIINNGQGEPHHAMFWTGKRNEQGEPLLIGFNGLGKTEETDVNASYSKDGNIRQITVIDTNTLLQKNLCLNNKHQEMTKNNNKDLIKSSFSNPKNQKNAEKIAENKSKQLSSQDIQLLKMKVLAGKSI